MNMFTKNVFLFNFQYFVSDGFAMIDESSWQVRPVDDGEGAVRCSSHQSLSIRTARTIAGSQVSSKCKGILKNCFSCLGPTNMSHSHVILIHFVDILMCYMFFFHLIYKWIGCSLYPLASYSMWRALFCWVTAWPHLAGEVENNQAVVAWSEAERGTWLSWKIKKRDENGWEMDVFLVHRMCAKSLGLVCPQQLSKSDLSNYRNNQAPPHENMEVVW